MHIQYSLKKFLIASLVLILAISPIMFQQNVVAQDAPSVFVSPAENIYHTDTTSVGTEFDVTIEAADWVDPGVYSFELKLYFDSSMLEPVVEKIGIDPAFWITAFIAAGGLDTGDVPYVNPDTGETFLWFSATLLGAGGNIGGGILAKAGFRIIAAPATGKTLASDLDLRDVIMVNPSTTPPSAYPADYYTVQDGTFEFIAPQPPTPLIKASSHTWDMDEAEAAGRLFDITVSIEGLLPDWHLVGIQFWLEFDTTLLSTKEEWITEGDFLTQFGGTFSVNYTEGDSVIYGLLQLPPWQEPWPSGSGSVAVIQFEAIFIPPPAADCDLTLFNVVLVDADGIEIPYSLEDGHYTITVAPPPWLSVEPKTVDVEDLGDTFELSVAVNALDAGFRMVGAEFKVRYDTSVLATKEEWITEGTGNIMREVADRIGEGLFFQAYVQEDYGLIGIILLPLPDGTWPFYPEGTGVLAAIKFEAIAQLEDESIVTLVQLDDVLLVDSDAKEIAFDAEKTTMYGTCVVTILQSLVYMPPEHPMYPYSIDLRTQYVDPYGGQGYRVPSDAFAPQGQVDLEAVVTYRGDPVPNKPVAYLIEGPNGYEFTAVAFSDANGVALLDFSVPASSTYFGIWEVSASVDIAGVVVTDDLMFRVGWLIQVEAIKIDGVEVEDLKVLAKGKQYTLSATLKIATMQDPAKCIQLEGADAGVFLSYSGFDELNQPLISRNWVDLTGLIGSVDVVSIQDVTDFILDEDYWFGYYDKDGEYGRLWLNGEESIIIPSSAYTGVGVIYGNVFTDDPWDGGVPYSDPTAGMKQVWIQRAEPEPSAIKPLPTMAVASVSRSYFEVVPGEFTIEIRVEDIDASSQLVAIQFALEFDMALLRVDDVTEGPFVQQFGETHFIWIVEDNLLVGVLQLPPWPGPIGWMHGSGLLCTIHFSEIHTDPSASCALTLDDVLLVDNEGNTVDAILEHGYYEVIP